MRIDFKKIKLPPYFKITKRIIDIIDSYLYTITCTNWSNISRTIITRIPQTLTIMYECYICNPSPFNVAKSLVTKQQV